MQESIRRWAPRRIVLVAWAIAIAATVVLAICSYREPVACYFRVRGVTLEATQGTIGVIWDFVGPRQPFENLDYGFAGFGYAMTDLRGVICTVNRAPIARRSIWAPIWFPLVAFLGASLLVVRKVERLQMRPRQRPGLCPECGYDSRWNSTNVCPECGALAE